MKSKKSGVSKTEAGKVGKNKIMRGPVSPGKGSGIHPKGKEKKLTRGLSR